MSDSQLTYALHKRSATGKITHSISLRIGKKLCQAAQFYIGTDRLEFLFDMERSAGRIEKVDSGGHRLCKSGENGAIIRMPYIEASRLPFIEHPVAMENAQVVNKGIEFQFPAHLTKGKGLAMAAAEIDAAEKDKIS